MRRHLRFATLALAAAIGFSERAWPAMPSLAFGSVSDLGVTLQPDCKTTTQPALDGMRKALTTQGHFALYFDPDSIKPLPGVASGGFRYTFYVADRRGPSLEWTLCDTQVFPHGPFFDGNQQVPFKIVADGVEETGVMENVPFHSLANNYFLEFIKPSAPTPIELSGTKELPIPLRSLVKDIPVTIARQVTVKSDNPGYWDSWAEAGLPAVTNLTNKDTTVNVSAPPLRVMKVLFGTLTSLKPDAAHDKITVTLHYRCGLGVDRYQPIEIPVRFVPTLPSLLFALFAGSVLGTLAGQTLPGVWKGWRPAAERAGRAILLSALAEAFAFLLVAQGSKFTLFDIELDPRQFLSVFFIGLFVSGGRALFKLLQSGTAGPSNEPPASQSPAPLGTPEEVKP